MIPHLYAARLSLLPRSRAIVRACAPRDRRDLRPAARLCASALDRAAPRYTLLRTRIDRLLFLALLSRASAVRYANACSNHVSFLLPLSFTRGHLTACMPAATFACFRLLGIFIDAPLALHLYLLYCATSRALRRRILPLSGRTVLAACLPASYHCLTAAAHRTPALRIDSNLCARRCALRRCTHSGTASGGVRDKMGTSGWGGRVKQV